MSATKPSTLFRGRRGRVSTSAITIATAPIALKTLIERRAQTAAAGRVHYAFEWQPSNAEVFLTKPGPFTDLAIAAIAEVTGRKPKLSTSGGTSDARFITKYCPVLEFGLVGQTMHQVDECAPVADLATLTAIYRRIIEKYFG